jgi:hypothetical protein
MPVPRRRSRFKRFLTALGFAALVGAYPLWRAARLAADPSGPKECPPLTPEPTGRTQTDTREQPTIEVSNRASLPWAQRGGSINDASCLNRTFVLGLVQVATVDDVRNALQFARESRVKVSIAGVRHSMGGHAFARNAIVLDMTRFNRMSLDAEQRVLIVQAGATWHDIQTYLHPRFAVKAMQSTDIFTVGGSISVNAHGEGAFLPAVPTPLHARAARALVPRAPRVLPGEAGERPRRTPDEHVLRKVLPRPRHRRTLSRSILMRHKRRKDLTRPGGFAPPDPLSPFARGDPFAPLRSGGARLWRAWRPLLR